MSYLLSVIIPTKNRQDYCLAAIKQIILLNANNIQIVIQDNSDLPSLKDEIKLLKCNQIKYNYNGNILSFVDNFSEAVDLADGEYVCMIGDDDGILPNIIQVARYAKINELDAIVPGLNSVYIWPMQHSIVRGGEAGYLCLSFISKNMCEIDPLVGLSSLLAAAGQNYQQYDIPRIYHGIVRRDILIKVKERTGHYFGGLTPDIYMATALSILCKKVVRLGFPVTISGICNGSGSANSATGKHTGKLKDAPHFIGHHEAYVWSKEVPAIYTVETIWADTMLHALDELAPEYKKYFNIKRLVEICAQKYPQFDEEIRRFAIERSINYIVAKLNGQIMVCVHFIKRCINKAIRSSSAVKKYYGVEDIDKASVLTQAEIANKGIKI